MDNLHHIAALRVLTDILTDLDPGGSWRQDPLYLKWRRCHYSLTRGQIKHLIKHLDEHRKHAERLRFSLEYNQLDLMIEQENRA